MKLFPILILEISQKFVRKSIKKNYAKPRYLLKSKAEFFVPLSYLQNLLQFYK